MPYTLLIVAAMSGAIVGSFVGVVAIRLPRHITVVSGRSRCDACDRIIGARDLIPVLSFLALRGRCRGCGAEIAIDQIIAEIGGAIVALLAVIAAPSIVAAGLLATCGWTLLALALLDARAFWLPNAITLPLLAGGLAAAPLLPLPSFTQRLLGAMFGYASLALVRKAYRHYRGREGLGGGDAKLFAAIGAWLGLAALPGIMIIAGVLGLLLALSRKIKGEPIDRFAPLPLGTLLAIAAIMLLPVMTQGGLVL